METWRKEDEYALISSCENLNPTHERGPPAKVILFQPLALFKPHAKSRRSSTHKCEYTPGIGASPTAFGKLPSHLSGFHSAASSPHSSVFLFDAKTETTTLVPLGTKTSLVEVPSLRVMGLESERVVSCSGLETKNLVSYGILSGEKDVHSR